MADPATSTPVPSRRGLFALAALPALALPLAAHGGGGLLDLEEQRSLLMAAYELAKSDEETLAITDAVAAIECRIADAPCDSPTALAVKLRTVVRDSVVFGSMYAIDYEALIDGMARFAEART